MTYTFVARSFRPFPLADRLRAAETVRTVIDGELVYEKAKREWFAGVQPVDLSGVSDWWDSIGPDAWPHESLTPCLRSPWPKVWAEWIDKNPSRGGSMPSGLLMTDLTTDQIRQFRDPRNATTKKLLADFILVHGMPITGILIVNAFLIPLGETQIDALPTILYPYDAEGRAIREPFGNRSLSGVIGAAPSKLIAELSDSGPFAVWKLFTALMRVRGFAASDVRLPRAERRRIKKHQVSDYGPPPWICYKSLTITLPGASESSGTSRTAAPNAIPFHLVRGHFADYRNGKGLFGKHKGLIWVPLHHRGLQRVGVVAKSYASQVNKGAT